MGCMMKGTKKNTYTKLTQCRVEKTRHRVAARHLHSNAVACVAFLRDSPMRPPFAGALKLP